MARISKNKESCTLSKGKGTGVDVFWPELSKNKESSTFPKGKGTGFDVFLARSSENGRKTLLWPILQDFHTKMGSGIANRGSERRPFGGLKVPVSGGDWRFEAIR